MIPKKLKFFSLHKERVPILVFKKVPWFMINIWSDER